MWLITSEFFGDLKNLSQGWYFVQFYVSQSSIQLDYFTVTLTRHFCFVDWWVKVCVCRDLRWVTLFLGCTLGRWQLLPYPTSFWVTWITYPFYFCLLCLGSSNSSPTSSVEMSSSLLRFSSSFSWPLLLWLWSVMLLLFLEVLLPSMKVRFRCAVPHFIWLVTTW